MRRYKFKTLFQERYLNSAVQGLIVRLRGAFVNFLKSRGIYCISTNSKKVFSEEPISYIARNFASGKFSIYEGQGRFAFNLEGEKIQKCNYIAWKEKRGINRDEMKDLLDKFPYIAVDCSLKSIHNEKELKSLIKQVEWTLRVVREFMWEERYVVAGMETKTSALHYPSIEDFIFDKKPEKIILLDPNADEIFQGDRADCYIIGGIVDKAGNKRGTTELIYRRLKEKGIAIERRKIILRGDVIGVPDRINHIAEIVLRSIIDGENVEEAIKKVQSRTIARWRLRKEIVKNSKRISRDGKTFRIIEKSFYSKIKEWLNVELEDFYRCAGDMGVIVVDDSFISAEGFKVNAKN